MLRRVASAFAVSSMLALACSANDTAPQSARGGTGAGNESSSTSAGGGSSGTKARAGESGSESRGGGLPSHGGAGSDSGGGSISTPGDALGAHPFEPSVVTRGGTMTFKNVGAPGWWPRRIDRDVGDTACDYKDGSDTWGGHCCMKQQHTESDTLAPFDAEMTLILKAIDVKQLAVYQPRSTAAGAWQRVTDWDDRSGASRNLWFTQKGDGSRQFPGTLSKNDCVGYLSQEPVFSCGDGRDYYCPDDAGVLHRGFSGSKLIVMLASMSFDDADVQACDEDAAGHPGPWVALVASELIRDGGRKWNGLCNCYSKTGSVGDGCGEINVFEVVMDDNEYSNREFASTGVRSYQAGHVGGAVCGSACDRDALPDDVEVVDACAKRGYEAGPELAIGGDTDGCPVWRRPEGDRYLFILLDEQKRTIQVGVVHPGAIPEAAAALLPELPSDLSRSAIDNLVDLRLPQ
jgi:hypothetical protein